MKGAVSQWGAGVLLSTGQQGVQESSSENLLDPCLFLYKSKRAVEVFPSNTAHAHSHGA